jgi:Ala-tRNA(Pro) deacylase
MITPAVHEFLRRSNVAYTVFPHRPAFTAPEEAAATHTPGVRWAKTVSCFADGRPVLAVVAAHCQIDLTALARILEATQLRITREDELPWLYPECEPGAMPPFGPLYNQTVVLDVMLAREPVIVFHGGTHRDAVRMHVEDFVTIAHPLIGRFAEPSNGNE